MTTSNPDTVDGDLPPRLFVSHASEDKPFVKQLTDAILRTGLRVWYDDYEIQIGDSIRAKINEGLRESEYGVIVLSHEFFKKDWPQQELAALASLLQSGRLLPIFRGINHHDLKLYDPLMVGIRGESHTKGVKELAKIIAMRVRGPGQVDDKGRTVYRRQTIRLVDLPTGENVSLQNMVFEDCLLQGPAVLWSHDENLLDGCLINPEMFWAVRHLVFGVGAIGLRNITFRRCRFKEVGIVVSTDALQQLANMPVATSIPEHLL